MSPQPQLSPDSEAQLYCPIPAQWPAMSDHDYLIALLHLGSFFEHRLMTQYLYAAYSLGGSQVDPVNRSKVAEWQDAFVTVAREEMGHMLTVQNVLTFLGAGVSIGTVAYPWNIQVFPMEPLSEGSLACYLFAEMPDNRNFPEYWDIQTAVLAHLKELKGELLPIGLIYAKIMELLRDEEKIPDVALHPETYEFQASWDDWGRGYAPPPRRLDASGSLEPAPAKNDADMAKARPFVRVDRVATRTEALAALTALSIQGEGPGDKGTESEFSHFERFMAVHREMKEAEASGWHASRDIPTEPSAVDTNASGYIKAEHSRAWAVLFNLRYRLLTTFLLHTYNIARETRSNEPSVRAGLMHRVFGEMYNLKTLAGILVELPRNDDRDPDDTPRAGPPFELWYNHRLPPGDADCWALCLDILATAQKTFGKILATEVQPNPERRAYLQTLRDLDAQTTQWINSVIGGMNSKLRYQL